MKINYRFVQNNPPGCLVSTAWPNEAGSSFELKKMTTKQLIQMYFMKVKEKSDWQTCIAADIKFESPSPTTFGKEAYIIAASRFFQMAETLEVKNLVVEGETVCAWVDYSLRLKSGKKFNCLVAELLEVRNNQIVSSAILFDTLALKMFTSES
jgi:ketosteroid isomerase-like protein